MRKFWDAWQWKGLQRGKKKKMGEYFSEPSDELIRKSCLRHLLFRRSKVIRLTKQKNLKKKNDPFIKISQKLLNIVTLIHPALLVSRCPNSLPPSVHLKFQSSGWLWQNLGLTPTRWAGDELCSKMRFPLINWIILVTRLEEYRLLAFGSRSNSKPPPRATDTTRHDNVEQCLVPNTRPTESDQRTSIIIVGPSASLTAIRHCRLEIQGELVNYLEGLSWMRCGCRI